MQYSTSSSNNSAALVPTVNRLCCGSFGLEAWVSHTTKNYKRPYWRCKHCGQFVRWVEADLVIELKELSSKFSDMSMRLTLIEEDIKKCLEMKDEVWQLREQIECNDVVMKELRQSVGVFNQRFMIVVAIILLVMWYLM
ncbi:hypothetical protein Dimus_002442 [Dionaea muscipula]